MVSIEDENNTHVNWLLQKEKDKIEKIKRKEVVGWGREGAGGWVGVEW